MHPNYEYRAMTLALSTLDDIGAPTPARGALVALTTPGTGRVVPLTAAQQKLIDDRQMAIKARKGLVKRRAAVQRPATGQQVGTLDPRVAADVSDDAAWAAVYATGGSITEYEHATRA